MSYENFGKPEIQRNSSFERFLSTALPRLQNDPRIVGVAAGGSWITGNIDEYSDIDLVLAIEPARYSEIMTERMSIAQSLGSLLAAFTGEHVGEPRLLICLYDSPLLHVDLKFVALPDMAQRVEEPILLWQREQRVSEVLSLQPARFPLPDLQWIEDRFWVWIHYGAAKLGRGELFEVIALLGFLREQVLAPLIAMRNGDFPRGVRKIEINTPEEMPALLGTLALHDRNECGIALQNSVALYRELREHHAPLPLLFRIEAERAATNYLNTIVSRSSSIGARDVSARIFRDK